MIDLYKGKPRAKHAIYKCLIFRRLRSLSARIRGGSVRKRGSVFGNEQAILGAATARSPLFVPARVNRKSAILIAGAADREFRRHPVLQLDHLPLRRGHIGRKRNEDLARHALLD